VGVFGGLKLKTGNGWKKTGGVVGLTKEPLFSGLGKKNPTMLVGRTAVGVRERVGIWRGERRRGLACATARVLASMTTVIRVRTALNVKRPFITVPPCEPA
jgi:hypothetical protein